jgi:hypothetical protein
MACLTAIQHNLTLKALCYGTQILRRIIQISPPADHILMSSRTIYCG